MTCPPRRRRARPWLAAGIASLALLLGGCVFLRLLAFKHQLAEFDRNFTLETSEGVRIGCLNPVLLGDDFRWLGITPETVKQVGQAEQWHVRWVKQPPASSTEKTVYDVDAEMIFSAGKLTRLVVPERYFAQVPKAFLVDLIRGAGSADVDRARRSAAVTLPGATPARPELVVTQQSMVALLGAPTRQWTEGPRNLLHYLYHPTPPGGKGKKFEMTLSFARDTGRLLLLEGRLPTLGRLAFKFELPPPAGAANARAAVPPTP